MRERILAAAERRIRAAGYNAVSFREIAAEVGVKSASVHCYFPQKQGLGAVLVRRYSQIFTAELGQISTTPKSPETMFRSYLQLHLDVLVIDQLICLCAILGAVFIGFPEKINVEMRRFFRPISTGCLKPCRPRPISRMHCRRLRLSPDCKARRSFLRCCRTALPLTARPPACWRPTAHYRYP